MIHKIWHNWLVLRSIPRNVSWLSDSVSIDSLVVLMEYWLLSGSPFSVGIWNWWVLWKNSCEVPPEEIWVVQQSSCVELMVVENNWSLISQTSSESLRYKDDEVEVSQPASNIEIFNREFSNDCQTKEASNLTSGGVISPVPVGLGDWSYNNFFSFTLWEPRLKNIKIFLCFICPGWKPFLEVMLRETETNKIIILNVFRSLEVSHSSLSIIEGVLFILSGKAGRLIVTTLDWDESLNT